MPFSGNNFVRNQNFTADRDAGAPNSTIAALKVDDEFDNVAAGLTTLKTGVETNRSLLPALSTGVSANIVRCNVAGTGWEHRTLAQAAVDIGIVAADRAIFKVSGSYTWTVPENVTRIFVEVYGAGGGAGCFNKGTVDVVVVGGGGGGYASGFRTVAPGQSFAVTVGAKGAGNNSGAGTDGTSSSFAGSLQGMGGKAAPSAADTGAGGSTAATEPYAGIIRQDGGAGGKTDHSTSSAEGGNSGGPLGCRTEIWMSLGAEAPGNGAAGVVAGSSGVTGSGGTGMVVIWWGRLPK